MLFICFAFDVDTSRKMVAALFLCGCEFVNYFALFYLFFPFHKLISFKNSWSCNSSALASEMLCIFHAALLWRQSRWAKCALLGAWKSYPDGFPWGTREGAPPLLQWALEVQPYGPVAPAALYRTGWSKTAICRYQHIFGLLSKLPSKVHFFLSLVVSSEFRTGNALCRSNLLVD